MGKIIENQGKMRGNQGKMIKDQGEIGENGIIACVDELFDTASDNLTKARLVLKVIKWALD